MRVKVEQFQLDEQVGIFILLKGDELWKNYDS